MRVLSVEGDKRIQSVPDIPTLKELGIDAEAIQWLVISASQKTPPLIVVKIMEVVIKVADDEAFEKLLESQGAEARYITSEGLEDFINKETKGLTIIYKQLLEEQKSKK